MKIDEKSGNEGDILIRLRNRSRHSITLPETFFTSWIGSTKFVSSTDGVERGFNSDERLEKDLKYSEKMTNFHQSGTHLLTDVRNPFITFEQAHFPSENKPINQNLVIPPLKIRTYKLSKSKV
jgi:hypothetical protein